MSRPSDPGFLVLHELRVKGLAPLSGQDATAVETLAGRGLIERREGVVTGWRLTAAGRLAHEQTLAEDVDGLADGLAEGYRRFLALNPALLTLVAEWQTSPDVSGRDRVALERLEVLHAAAVSVVDGLGGLLGRFGPYRVRLTAALDRVRSGDLDYVARPLVDSYHTVWFELHEDLLASLGIARGSEQLAETEVA